MFVQEYFRPNIFVSKECCYHYCLVNISQKGTFDLRASNLHVLLSVWCVLAFWVGDEGVDEIPMD